MKGIELPKETIEALLNGANKFIVPCSIKHTCDNFDIAEDREINTCKACNKIHGTPLQIGDKFYVQEEFRIGYWNSITEQMAFDYKIGKDKSLKDIENELFWDLVIESKCELDVLGIKPYSNGDYSWEKYNSPLKWRKAETMKYEQSRIKDLVTVDFKIKRVQDLVYSECYEITGNIYYTGTVWWEFFKRWIERKYSISWDKNPYVFLYTIEKEII